MWSAESPTSTWAGWPAHTRRSPSGTGCESANDVVVRLRHVPFDSGQPIRTGVPAGILAEVPACTDSREIRIVPRRVLLNDFAGVHNGDAVSNSAMTPMSCVMSMTPISRSSDLLQQVQNIGLNRASSAVVGSSADEQVGSHASAIAMTARWRIPPENSCGNSSTRRAASGMPTARSSSMASTWLRHLPIAVEL